MDRKIEKKHWTSRHIFMFTGGLAIIALSIYTFVFRDNRGALRIDRDKIIISEIQERPFQETLQTNGIVQPIQTTYLDAIEGGVIQHVFLESGTAVQQGDTILILTNSALQLQVMQQTSGLYDQINNARNSRLNLEQNSLMLREKLADAKVQMDIWESQYQRQMPLFKNNLISEQDFQTTEKNYLHQKTRFQLANEAYHRDSLQTLSQLQQLNESEQRMYQNLDAVQQILNNLIITAPISGQLSTSELHQGQSVAPGERIGQIDILHSYKVRVEVDEYYLPRINPALTGNFTFAGNEYELEVTKIYPVVVNGRFFFDMEFTGHIPENLRRGQSLRIRLNLSDFEYALQLNRGAFTQQTGGNWIYVLDESGRRAYKRNIQLGRSNAEFQEVISGLQAGEKVIISGYETFGNHDVLIIEP